MIYNRNIYNIFVRNSRWFYPNWIKGNEKQLTKHLSLSRVLRVTCVARYPSEVFSKICTAW